MADNLIASGKMKEMIIVLNTGYAFREDGNHHPSLGAFDQELVNDCMPFIEERYRIQKRKDHPEKLEEAFHLFYVACGTEDFFFEKTKSSVEDVLAHGTKLDVFFDKGRHDWIFWRHCAADFLTKIFK